MYFRFLQEGFSHKTPALCSNQQGRHYLDMESPTTPTTASKSKCEKMYYDGMDAESKCIDEIHVFLRGAEGGTQRLKEVLSTLFDYYKIVTSDEKASLLLKCGLTPYRDPNKACVTFYFDGSDIRNQFRPPKGYPPYAFGESSDSDEKPCMTLPYNDSVNLDEVPSDKLVFPDYAWLALTSPPRPVT